MVGKVKLFMISLMFVLMSVGLVGCKSKEEITTIGISQIVEHKALDRTREGFIDGLKSRGYEEGKNIKFNFQNAQGDTNNANLIAQTFVSLKVDMIMAIATSSAQAAKNATDDIPIVFSAVTDPVSAGLVESLDKPNTNLTGTSDMSPYDKQFDLIKAIFGTNKRIGVIYNISEVNSVVQIDIIKDFAKKDGHSLNIKGVTSSVELNDALTGIIGDVDLLLIPTDNLMASSMPLIVELANEKKVPIIGSEEALVEAGALITEGIDYYNLGFQTGLMAADILSGKKKVNEMSVETLKETKLVINENELEQLGIEIPEELLNRAILVGSSD